MDAHSRGRADGIDPADQWVLNPQTGNYELRLDHSTGESGDTAGAAAGSSRTATAEGGGRRAARESGSRTRTREDDAAGKRREVVPGQRSRRGSQGTRGAAAEPPAA